MKIEELVKSIDSITTNWTKCRKPTEIDFLIAGLRNNKKICREWDEISYGLSKIQ